MTTARLGGSESFLYHLDRTLGPRSASEILFKSRIPLNGDFLKTPPPDLLRAAYDFLGFDYPAGQGEGAL